MFTMIASASSTTQAATVVETVDPSTINNAYVNVFTLTGNYEYGYVNSLPTAPATFSGNNLTLGVNSNASDGSTPPSTPGTFMVSSATYAQSDAIAGNTVTFNFSVTADSLTAPYTATAFVGDFLPDYSSSTQQAMLITGVGNYSVTLATAAGDHIQYGFRVDGPNASDAAAPGFGTLTVAPTATAVPEPASLCGAALIGGGALLRRRRQA